MDNLSPASQVCMSRESHNMQKKILHIKKKLSTRMYLSKRKFHNRELVQNLTQLRWSLETMKIVRPDTTWRKTVMSTVYRRKIYIYTRLPKKKKKKIMPCYMTEKEEKKKKILCLLQEVFLRFPNFCAMRGKLWIMCGWSCPFIVLVRESLIAIKTHLVKTRLARKRSQNKVGFLEGIRHCEFLRSNWN